MVNTDKQPIQAIRCQSPVLRKNILDITQLRSINEISFKKY